MTIQTHREKIKSDLYEISYLNYFGTGAVDLEQVLLQVDQIITETLSFARDYVTPEKLSGCPLPEDMWSGQTKQQAAAGGYNSCRSHIQEKFVELLSDQ